MIFKYTNNTIVVLPRKRITKTPLGSQIKTGERVIIIFQEEPTKHFNTAFEVVYKGEKVQKIMVGKFLDSTVNILRNYNIDWLFNSGHRFLIERLGLNLNFDEQKRLQA